MPFNFQLLRELLQLGTRENFHQRMVDLSFTNLNFRPSFTSLNPLPMDRVEGNHYLGGYLFSMTEGMPRPYWMSVTFCSKGNFQFYSKLKFYKWPFSTEQAKQTQGAKGRGDYWLYLDSTSNIWRQNPSLLHHSHPTPWNAIDFSGYLELYDIFWCSIDCPNKQAKKKCCYWCTPTGIFLFSYATLLAPDCVLHSFHSTVPVMPNIVEELDSTMQAKL